MTNFADAPALQRSVVEEQRGRDAVAVAWVSSKVAPCVTSVQSMLLQSGAKSRGSMPLQIAYVGDCPIGKPFTTRSELENCAAGAVQGGLFSCGRIFCAATVGQQKLLVVSRCELYRHSHFQLTRQVEAQAPLVQTVRMWPRELAR